MLTQEERQERDIILSRINYDGKIDVNMALVRRLHAITEQAARNKGEAIFAPVDAGKEMVWG